MRFEKVDMRWLSTEPRVRLSKALSGAQQECVDWLLKTGGDLNPFLAGLRDQVLKWVDCESEYRQPLSEKQLAALTKNYGEWLLGRPKPQKVVFGPRKSAVQEANEAMAELRGIAK